MGAPENPFAFPLAMTAETVDNAGMTLRDWFAGQALAGLLGNDLGGPGKTMEGHQEHFASVSYGYADAMLAARMPVEEPALDPSPWTSSEPPDESLADPECSEAGPNHGPAACAACWIPF